MRFRQACRGPLTGAKTLGLASLTVLLTLVVWSTVELLHDPSSGSVLSYLGTLSVFFLVGLLVTAVASGWVRIDVVAVERDLGAWGVHGRAKPERQVREAPKTCLAIAEAIDYGIWVADADGRCRYASDSFLKLLGITQEQCADLGWTERLHPDDSRATVDAWLECVHAGRVWYRELRLLGIDGAYHAVLARGVAVLDEAGTVQGWAGIHLDISRWKGAEAALRDADRRKDEFLATLAHELRNPVAPIRQATQILGIAGTSESQRAWAREVISRQVDRMALLLDDLLDVSRISRGQLSLRKARVGLEKIVADAVETAQPMMDAKRHHLQVHLPTTGVELDVDPLRLSQALSNLLTNAAKYTDAGGRIVLFARSDEAGVTFIVQDNGIGLAASSLRQFFEMFAQVESALERSQGGLGIGLALVKGLVALHGGSVEAASDGLGQGSTFRIWLPRACVVNCAAAEQAAPTPELLVAGPRRTVLVVDDDVDAADSLSMLLGVSGHSAAVAHSGQAALSLAFDMQPQACILDIGMPECSGYDVARAIRAQPWGHAPVLIAVSGWARLEDIDRARLAGFDHHLTKPVDPREVERLLATPRERLQSVTTH